MDRMSATGSRPAIFVASNGNVTTEGANGLYGKNRLRSFDLARNFDKKLFTAVNIKPTKSHRIDVHRHADAFLEQLEAAEKAAKIETVKPKTSLAVKYMRNLARGLETMFGAIHIVP